MEGNGEERVFHLARQHDFQPVPRAFVAEDVQAALRLIDRDEERQALDVIPMGVGQEQGQIERLLVKLGDQLLPEQA